MIEEFIVISVDYATCFRILTISAIVFANICCFIFKISYQTFLDRTLSNIYFKLFKQKHVYESLCCLFKKCLECYGCYSSASEQISFEGFHARSMETWDTSLGILINKSQKDAYGEEFTIMFSGLSLVLSRADTNSSDSRIGQDRKFSW